MTEGVLGVTQGRTTTWEGGVTEVTSSRRSHHAGTREQTEHTHTRARTHTHTFKLNLELMVRHTNLHRRLPLTLLPLLLILLLPLLLFSLRCHGRVYCRLLLFVFESFFGQFDLGRIVDEND